MKYRVFATEQEAIDAEYAISKSMNYPKPGVNAATSKIEPNVLTTRWATPQQIVDGRWVFVSPDDEGVETGDDWFPQVDKYLV